MHAFHHVPTRLTTTVVAAALLATVALPAAAAGEPTVTTVADGFAGPLGLDIDKDGTARVGEAFAGLLTAIGPDGARRVELASGAEIAGVAHDRGSVVFTTTAYEEPSEPGGEPGAVVESTLERLLPDGTSTTIASLYDHEVAQNPDGGVTYGVVGADEACLAQWPMDFGPAQYTGIVDSHAYAVAATKSGWVVADAAANALLAVDPLAGSAPFPCCRRSKPN